MRKHQVLIDLVALPLLLVAAPNLAAVEKLLAMEIGKPGRKDRKDKREAFELLRQSSVDNCALGTPQSIDPGSGVDAIHCPFSAP